MFGRLCADPLSPPPHLEISTLRHHQKRKLYVSLRGCGCQWAPRYTLRYSYFHYTIRAAVWSAGHIGVKWAAPGRAFELFLPERWWFLSLVERHHPRRCSEMTSAAAIGARSASLTSRSPHRVSRATQRPSS